MKLLILGASGRTGRQMVEAAKRDGHTFKAVSRRALDYVPEGQTLLGSPADPDLLGPALTDVDVVLNCLASDGKEQICLRTTEQIINLALPGVRYVVIGGAAVDAPGDQKGVMDRFASRMTRLFAGKMVAERQEEFERLAASTLDFTFLRPPQLVDKTTKSGFEFSFDAPTYFRIARKDLAEAMLAAARDDSLRKRAPFVSWPK